MSHHAVIEELIRHGDIEALQHLPIDSLHAFNNNTDLLVTTALDAGQWHVMRFLTTLPNELSCGWTLVLCAALDGDLAALRAASKRELRHTSTTGIGVVHAAAIAGQSAVIEAFTSRRWTDGWLPGRRQQCLDVRQVTLERGDSALHLAARHGQVGVVRLLLELGLDARDRNQAQRNALHEAADAGHLDVVHELVERVQVDDGEPLTGTALHMAALKGHVDVVECLMQRVDVNTLSPWLGTPLHAAAVHGQCHVIEVLVDGGADLHAVGQAEGNTPLHVAAGARKPAAVQLLARLGADVNAQDRHGASVLHAAVRKGGHETLRCLLQLGADRTIEDDQGHTARDTASDVRVVNLLETYFPITPPVAQLLLGLRGPTPSALTRLGEHELFEPHVVKLVKCFLTSERDPAMDVLYE